jgi:hypothetical protein
MGSGGIAPPFLTSALDDGGEWPISRSRRFTPGEISPGAHWIGGWVGLKDGLNAVKRKNDCRFKIIYRSISTNLGRR